MAGGQGSPLPIYFALQSETKGNQENFLAAQFPTCLLHISTQQLCLCAGPDLHQLSIDFLIEILWKVHIAANLPPNVAVLFFVRGL